MKVAVWKARASKKNVHAVVPAASLKFNSCSAQNRNKKKIWENVNPRSSIKTQRNQTLKWWKTPYIQHKKWKNIDFHEILFFFAFKFPFISCLPHTSPPAPASKKRVPKKVCFHNSFFLRGSEMGESFMRSISAHNKSIIRDGQQRANHLRNNISSFSPSQWWSGLAASRIITSVKWICLCFRRPKGNFSNPIVLIDILQIRFSIYHATDDGLEFFVRLFHRRLGVFFSCAFSRLTYFMLPILDFIKSNQEKFISFYRYAIEHDSNKTLSFLLSMLEKKLFFGKTRLMSEIRI